MENKIKVVDEYLSTRRVSKRFTIEAFDKEIEITKWWYEDEWTGEYEVDWDFDSEQSKEVYNELTDEQQDELEDFISDLS